MEDELLTEVIRAAKAVTGKGFIVTRENLGSYESDYLVFEYLFIDLVNALEKYEKGSGENEVCNRYRDAGYCQCSQY